MWKDQFEIAEMKSRGRPVEYPMPEPIDDTPDNRKSRHAESGKKELALPEGIRAQATW